MGLANARKIAVNALCRVEQDKAYSNLVLNQILSGSGEISKKDKALASVIFYGVLDRKITLDYILNKLSKTPVKKMQCFTKQALRSGLYQILYMDKIPHSAAVNETVSLVKHSKEQRNSGFVNAVLRAALNQNIQLPKGSDIHALSVRYSVPAYIVTGFLKDYSAETTEKILASFLEPAPLYIKVNTLKVTVEELISLLGEQGISSEPFGIEGCLKISGGIDIKNNTFYKNGYFYAEDISSQKAALSLGAQKNQRVLDVCAAPGSKTFTVAIAMENSGEIVSCDLYDSRVRLIESSAKRLGLNIVKAMKNDACVYSENMGTFDRILCDVPCSGWGVIRRKPEIKYKQPEDYGQLEGIQYTILCASSKYLKKGGRLVYSTCTLRKDENENIVNRFLKENSDFVILEQETAMPFSGGADGFYHAVLEKR